MTTPADTPQVRLYGIRHHGPGCARSLLQALQDWQPDCVLIEGPPEADELLPFALDAAMAPPVALLAYCPDEPRRAVFYPFAEFSPEWQALTWGVHHAVPTRFIDLPRAYALAQEKAAEEAAAAALAGALPDDDLPPAVQGDGGSTGEPAKTQTGTQTEAGAPSTGHEVTPPADEADAAPHSAAGDDDARPADPLDWLAQASGHADGEAWWNHLVEERADATDLFAAIAEAMTEVRNEWERRAPARPLSPRAEARRLHEAQREAHMRQCIRAARKEGHRRIAVVCGAWHVPALAAEPPAKADQALLKGLPKLKVQCTWVPWTHRHLSLASGYGAGVQAPGWYGFLWGHDHPQVPRSVGWLSRVARLLRERDLDCSSAHVIEAARLADALAALRDRPAPGLEELNEATRSVVCMGEDGPLRLIEDALTIGDRLGSVPEGVPGVPLQRDLEQAQKRLRLKPEATQRTLDLDLREPNDLARSHLLHRLRLLDIGWGEPVRGGRGSRGSFRESWRLQWQPELAVSLISASRWGATIEQASSACVLDRAARAQGLDTLAELVDEVLLAELAAAVPGVTRALEDRAAVTGDTLQLLRAMPPLAQVFRYGSVRNIDTRLVAQVLDSLLVRAAIGLPLACAALDEEAAHGLRASLLEAHAAVGLRDAEVQTTAWQDALARLADAAGSAALLRGLATRLLLDDGVWDIEAAGTRLHLSLSSASDPAEAAAWLEGFLNRNALVLLHDSRLWALVDAWLAGLHREHFERVLPLVRRTFADFSATERRSLGERARQPVPDAGMADSGTAPAFDLQQAERALPLLRQLLGLPA